jgi:nucleoside-diphosphate-sugar epimerase
MATVLVTGGTGFVGVHCIVQLLAAGHDVRTTMRNPKREGEVRAMVERGGVSADGRLRFFVADLEKDDGWSDAVGGCEYVLHVASPFPEHIPKHEDELIRPAREGALRVLRVARDAGIKRVVLTSSFAAVGYGQPDKDGPFDETSWTNPDGPGVMPYVKSKTLAERAAWDFVEKEGKALELSVVNPVGILGPTLGKDLSTSILIVQRMLGGMLPGCPKAWFGIVDVRDVADLHLRAMTDPKAKGERFICVSGDFMSVMEIADVLRSQMAEVAKKVPRRELPNFVVRLASLFDPAVKQIVPELGRRKNATNAKARTLLGWSPRSREEAIVSTAKSLLELGLVETKK